MIVVHLHCGVGADVALYLLGISPTHFASFPHPFASFPHQICFVSPKKCFISPTVCCISPTKCFISPTVSCISLCNVVSRCQKIFYQIFLVFFSSLRLNAILNVSNEHHTSPQISHMIAYTEGNLRNGGFVKSVENILPKPLS